MMTRDLKDKLLSAQRNEITEHAVYARLARTVRNKAHADVLDRIAREELAHYACFRDITQQDVKPDGFKVLYYSVLAQCLGLNFGLKLMEKGEDLAQEAYTRFRGVMPNIDAVIHDEKQHEEALLALIEEDRLKYVSSVILGLNDALVELTATVAGFTLALQNTKLIGMLGLITGMAAAMSMAASEYLATKHDKEDKDPFKASLYTGISYIGVVLVLVLPYFLFTNIFISLGLTILLAVVTIFIFTFYVAVAQGHEFKGKFIEMAVLSVGIAMITFLIGMVARQVFGISV